MSRVRKAAWGVAALVLAIILGWVYLLLNPADRVAVVIRHVPTDCYFVSLSVTTDQGLVSLKWSLDGEGGIPFEMHPVHCLCSRPEQDWPSVEPCSVVWQKGREYGVITRSNDGGWQAAWFPAAEVPVIGRWPVFGGGRAEFDCSGRTMVPLTADQVRALGLQDVIDRRP